MPLPGKDKTAASTAAPKLVTRNGLTTGIILAGGRSSRMGQDKASTLFYGETFLSRTARLLKAMDLADIVILGHRDTTGGQEPFPGPARALVHWLQAQPHPRDLLVVPVDMPVLTKPPLEHLMAQPHGAYFHDLYLPLFAPKARFEPHLPAPGRLRDLLQYWRLEAQPIAPEWEIALAGVNTPHELAQLEAAAKSNKTG